MSTAGRAEERCESRRLRIAWRVWAAAILCFVPCTSAADPAGTRRVVVLYPTSDGQPGIIRFDQGLRSTLKSSSRETIEVYNEYLDSARFADEGYQRRLADFLSQKYAGRKIDVVIPALAPSLDFVLKYRDRIFPGVPIVYGAIERSGGEGSEARPGRHGHPDEGGPGVDARRGPAAPSGHPPRRRRGGQGGDGFLLGRGGEEGISRLRGGPGVHLPGRSPDGRPAESSGPPPESEHHLLSQHHEGRQGRHVRPGGGRRPTLRGGERPRLRALSHLPRPRDRRRPPDQLRGRGREGGQAGVCASSRERSPRASPSPRRAKTSPCSTGVS